MFTALTAGLALAGCQGDLGFTISEDGDLTTAFEFVDDEGLIQDGLTCDDLKGYVESEPQMQLFGTMSVEDAGSAGAFGCRMTFEDSALLSSTYVTDNGDTFTFEVSKAEGSMFESAFDLDEVGIGSLDFTATVTFPGDVIEASDGATIEGNTVTWHSYDDFLEGISATGYKTAGQKASSGFPVWGWIVIAVGVLLIVGIVLFAIRRGKNKTGNGPQPGTPAYPGNAGVAGQPYGQPYPGQPTNTAEQAAPYPSYPVQPGSSAQQPQYPTPDQGMPGQGYGGPAAGTTPYNPPRN
ncbi:hypothetical protein DDD63_10360 [Actinobaculum sp. 313]|nr:hypothetical protein DDD63_10360 [Actinobaculum sp. 313]